MSEMGMLAVSILVFSFRLYRLKINKFDVLIAAAVFVIFGLHETAWLEPR